MKKLPFFLILLLLGGCAGSATYPLGLNHPANPGAPLTPIQTRRTSLALDGLSRTAERSLKESSKDQSGEGTSDDEK